MESLKPRYLIGALALFAASAPLSTAQAELVQYSFEAQGKEVVVADPGDREWLNARGDMEFTLSAGLERKVRMRITDSDGNVLAEDTSGTLGPSDEITVDGDTYYGERFNLPAPDSAGSYVLRAQILDETGEVASEDVYPVGFDFTPPQVDGSIEIEQRQRGILQDENGNRIHGFQGVNSVWGFGGYSVSGISASGAPVERVDFVATDSEGTTRRQRGIDFNGDSLTVSREAVKETMPHNQDLYDLEVRVIDAAGNIGAIGERIGLSHRPFTEDRPKPEPVAVEDPGHGGGWNGSSTYVPYEDGMTVHTNPVRMVFRIDRRNYFGDTPWGLRPSQRNSDSTDELSDNVIHQTAEAVYVETNAHPISKSGVTQIDWSYGNQLVISETVPTYLRLADGVTKAPRVLEGQVYTTEGKRTHDRLNSDTGYKIERVVLDLEPRPYKQRIESYYASDVIVPAGAESAEIVYNSPRSIEPKPHRARAARSYVYHHGNRSLTSGRWQRLVFVDPNPPVIADVSVATDEMELGAHIKELSSAEEGNRYHFFVNEYANAEAISDEGERYELDQLRRDRATAQDYHYTFDLKGLPAGVYNKVEIETGDKRDNVTTETHSILFVRDREAPGIAFYEKGEPFEAGGSLYLLEDLTVDLSDDRDSNPRIESARLTGGPEGINVNLAWSGLGEPGQYRLEYPVMFPSLAAGDGYQLEVVASDAQGNEGTETVEFEYEPSVLDYGEIRIPQMPSEAAAWQWESPQIKDENGLPISGEETIIVKLGRTAAGPLTINGQTLAPGETIQTTYNFDTPNIALALNAGRDAESGEHPLLVKITRPGAPTLVGTVRTWDVGVSLDASPNWEPVSFMEDVVVSAATDAAGTCELTMNDQAAQASTETLQALQDSPKCLLEWTAQPTETRAQADPESGHPAVRGRVVETVETPVGYRVSLFDADGNPMVLASGERILTPQAPEVGFEVDGGIPGEITQIYQQADWALTQAEGLDCPATRDREAALQAAQEGEPSCLVEWTTWPANLAESGAGDGLSALRGYLPRTGEKTIGWKASVFAADGTEYVLEQPTRTFEVTPPTLDFTAEEDPNGVYRQVEDAVLALGLSEDSTSCEVTTDMGELNPEFYTPNHTCVVRFDEVPEGMTVDEFSYEPRLAGKIPTDGVKSVHWSVHGISATGELIQVGEDHLDFRVENPPKPQLSLLNAERLDDGSVPVSTDGSRFATAEATAPIGELELTVEGLPEETLETRGGNSFTRDSDSEVNLILRGQMDELWKHRTLTVTARYAELPGISVSEEFEIYGIPGAGIGAYLFSDREALNTEDLPVRMEIGKRTAGEVEYDVKKMGEWDAEIGASTRTDVDGSTVETPDEGDSGSLDLVKASSAAGDSLYLDSRIARVLGEEEVRPMRAIRPVTESEAVTGGVVEFDVPPGDESVRMLKGVATLRSPDGLYKRRLESNQVSVQVLEGYPLDPEMLARRTAGPAPYRTIISLRLDPMDRQALGEVEWLVREGGADQWVVERSGTGLVRFDHTFGAGEYELRARLHNRNTGATSQTQIVQINAYRELDVEVAGGNRTFPGTPLELEAQPTFGGEPFNDATIKWQIDGETVGTGRTFTLERDESTGVRLNVLARAPEAPADNRYAWSRERHSVRVSAPRSLRTRIDGPRTVDLEETGTFRAEIHMPYSGMTRDRFPVEGHWVLPDGTQLEGETVEWEYRGETIEGVELNYSPTESDFENGLAEIGYESWIEGYREETARTQTKRVRVTHYVWPEFAIQVQRYVKFAPSSMNLIVRTPGFYGRLDDPEYDWHLPESATDVRASGSRAMLTLTEAGTFDVGVTVTDARGNESTVSVPVETIEAEAFELDGSMRFSNRYQRAPLDLYARFRADGGHPRDRMDLFTYRLDGELIKEPSSDRSIRVQKLDAGEHKLEVVMQSEMGAEARWRRTIEVRENKPPVCQEVDVEYRESGPYYIMEASCSDEDGRITGYRWSTPMMDEPRRTTNRYVIRDDRDNKERPIELTVTAIDDAGGETTMTRSLTPQ